MKTALVLASAIVLSARGQGTFQNLDFEAATVPQSQPPGLVSAANALPGWTVYHGFQAQPQIVQAQILFNAATSGVPQIALLGTSGTGQTSIEGRFSVSLHGFYKGPAPRSGIGATIAQTGVVPETAQSILFKAQPGSDPLYISIDTEGIQIIALATAPNYILYGGNVSAFAGQLVELQISALWSPSNLSGWNLDSIEFSGQPIPEPSTVCLLLAGVGIIASRWPKKTSWVR